MRRRTQLQRAVAGFQAATDKAGGSALLTAVIGQAALDLAEGDHGAAQYFLSDVYRHHVTLLGLPGDYLPAGVTAADLRALVEVQPTSQRRARHKVTQLVTG